METEKKNIKALQKEEVVRILTLAGGKDFTLELLESDIVKGAPVNTDGTIDLFDYSAWLYDKRYNG